jgi:ABC-type sugar transport system substrate-binding protein
MTGNNGAGWLGGIAAAVRRAQRPLIILALVAFMAAALTACGSSGSSSSSESTTTEESTATESESGAEEGGSEEGEGGESATASAESGEAACGESVPIGPSNPTGIFKSLSPELQKIYASYPGELNESPWKGFKKKGPWSIGLIGFPSINSYFKERLSGIEEEFEKAKAEGLVEGSLVTSIPGSPEQMTPESQISAIKRMVSQGVDLILLEPAGGTADKAAIDAAGEAGVPVVMADALMPGSKYAQPVLTDNYSEALANAMGIIKEGEVLVVRGAEGNTLDEIVYQQTKADIESCPGMSEAGSVYGEYDDTTTKTVVQQLLASHPGELSGVVTQGGMVAGTVQALEAVGKEVPPIAMINPSGGALSWWLEKTPEYEAAAQGLNGKQAAYTFFHVAMRILSGKSPVANVLEIPAPSATNENLEEMAPKGQPLTYDGGPLGEPESWCGSKCLDQYFEAPGEA